MFSFRICELDHPGRILKCIQSDACACLNSDVVVWESGLSHWREERGNVNYTWKNQIVYSSCCSKNSKQDIWYSPQLSKWNHGYDDLTFYSICFHTTYKMYCGATVTVSDVAQINVTLRGMLKVNYGMFCTTVQKFTTERPYNVDWNGRVQE